MEAHDQNKNPANKIDIAAARAKRVPMSLPQLKLAVPDLPGYHLHWMLGHQGRIAQAIRAGYEFVTPDEVNLYNPDLAGDAANSGNTDLGSRVSVAAGGESEGQANRLYLMKLREEFWQDDQRLLGEKNEEIAASLRGGKTDIVDANPHGEDNRYIPEVHQKTVRNLFTRKHR